MLRNDLIVKLSEKDNDSVAVTINGVLVDVESVATDRGCIVLVLDPDELQAALSQAGVRKADPV
jgi:hypothetical protein